MPKILEEEGGCKINYEKQVALTSRHLIHKALKKVGRNITLHARNPKYNVTLNGNHTYITTDGTGTQTIDLETGERRTSRKEDIVKSAIISDATDTVDIYWPMVSSQDHPPHTRHLHDLEASLNNTEKHVTIETTINPKEAKYIIEIATAVVGDEKSLENNP